MTGLRPADTLVALQPLLGESLRAWGVKGTVWSGRSYSADIIISLDGGSQLTVARAAQDARPVRWVIAELGGNGKGASRACTSVLDLLMELRGLLDVMPEQIRTLRIGSPSGQQ